MVKGTFWKNSKELSHFKEESYEMAKIFWRIWVRFPAFFF